MHPLLTMPLMTPSMTSSTRMPTSAHLAPPSPILNPFVTPQPPPRVLSVTPRCVATPAHLLPSYHPPLSPQHPLSPRPPLSLIPPLLNPIREKVVSAQPLPHPPPVLWTPPRPLSPLGPSDLPQNSTSALCRCLSVSTSGSHRDGNQGSTNRVYRIWLKSSTPQKP